MPSALMKSTSHGSSIVRRRLRNTSILEREDEGTGREEEEDKEAETDWKKEHHQFNRNPHINH
jgi:hypothetical protein